MYRSDNSSNTEQYTYAYFLQDDVCRLCWAKKASHKIVTKSFQINTKITLINIIKDYLNIKVNDNEPNKVCSNCMEKIERFIDFKQICYEHDVKLREILQRGEIESKNVIEEIKSEHDNTSCDNTDTDDIFDVATKNNCSMNKKRISKKYQENKLPLYCNICSFRLESEEDLVIHNKESHGIENGGTVFKCFGCEKRFNCKRNRSRHEVHSCKDMKNGYKCGICQRYLPKRSMYEWHIREHRHNTSIDLPEHIFRCRKCTKLFKTKELLKGHMVEHGKSFICDTCGRVFTRQDYLHKHKLTHAGIKEHQCPHCDFRATQRSSLTVHIRKHTGERPYSCDLCPQRCISSSNLRAHRRRHLGLKKYECTICSKKFGYKISLDEHVTTKHGRCETYSCEHCGATYTRIRGLRRHLATKHGKQALKEKETLDVDITDNTDKIDDIKTVQYELKEGESVLLLKHDDGNVYMI